MIPTTTPPSDSTAYAAAHQATERWLFLTGDRDAIHRLARDGFKLAVDVVPASEAPSPGEAIIHSDRFVLVDGDGRIRGYFDPFDAGELEKLERAVSELGTETPAR